MFRYTSTPSKRACPIVQLLIVAMTAAVIGAITACSGEQPTTTARPQRVDPSPMQTIEAMAYQMAVLQTKAAESGGTNEDGREDRVRPAATVILTAAEEPTAAPTPAKAVIPTPSSTDICGRSPTLQKEILITLRSPSCSIINEAELYRIQCFINMYGDCEKPNWDWGESGPRPGDFAGLVNLKELEITGNFTIQPGTFTGSGIRHLKLKAERVEKGAFDGALIDRMDLNTASVPPKGALPASLRTLSMIFKAPEQAMQDDELKELINLEQLSLSVYRYDDSEELAKASGKKHPDEIEVEFNFPAGMVEGNNKLKSLKLWGAMLGDDTRSRADISVDNALVAELDELESISIGNLKPRNHLSGDPPLRLHPSSPLNRYINGPTEIGNWKNWTYGESLSLSTPE